MQISGIISDRFTTAPQPLPTTNLFEIYFFKPVCSSYKPFDLIWSDDHAVVRNWFAERHAPRYYSIVWFQEESRAV